MNSCRIVALLLLFCPLTSAAFASDQSEPYALVAPGSFELYENRDSIGSEITARIKASTSLKNGPYVVPTG